LATGAAFIGLARRRLDRSVLNLDGRGGGGGEELAKRRSRTARAGLSCSAMARVLVVDDEPAVRGALERALRLDAYDVALAADGREALDLLAAVQHDVVVLDLSMPHVDGLEVCRRLRAVGDRTPVLMLTARDAVDDRVQGLDTGADDYLVKPFSFVELAARLRALARRGPVERPAVLQAGDLHLDPSSRRVWRGTQDISLSPKEYALLETFLRRPGQVLDRFQLLEHAWDYEYENRSNVVDAYVRLLRKKIDKPYGVESIETVRGAGYRLREDGGR
jgi:two-component system, OmpR family, response regulator